MKKLSKIITTSILTMFLLVCSSKTFAQPGGVPDDPSLGNTNGAVGHPLQNGGASVDGGMNLFFLFAMAYGAKRYFQSKKKEEENTPGIINE
jgi:hypothetical protein